MAGETIESTFRDFTTLNVPSSGKHEPSKSEIRNLLNAFLGQQTGANAGALIYTTRTALEANTTAANATMAWVIGDPNPDNDGVYQFFNTSVWTKRGPLPYSVIHLNNADEGTANEIEVTTAVGIPSAAFGVLYLLNVTRENTGPVTVSINGGAPRPLVTNAGAPLLASAIRAPFGLLCVDDGTNLRLLVPGDIDAVIAQAEAILAAAEALAGSVFSFATEADFEAANIPSSTQYVRLAGYAAPGDAGAHTKVRIEEPVSPSAWQKQSNDGSWWEIADKVAHVAMFGVFADSGEDETVPLNDARDFLIEKADELHFAPGVYLWAQAALDASSRDIKFIGAGRGKTILRRNSDALSAAFNVTNSENAEFIGLTFDCNKYNFANGGHGLRIVGCNRITARRCSATDYVSTGMIAFTSGGDGVGKVEDIHFIECDSYGNNDSQNGIAIADGLNCSIDRCRAFDVGKVPGSPCYGLQLKNNCENCKILGGLATGAFAGIAFGQELAAGVEGVSECIACDTVIVNCERGFEGGKARYSRAENLVIDMTGVTSASLRRVVNWIDSKGCVATGLTLKGLPAANYRAGATAGDSEDCLIEFDHIDNNLGATRLFRTEGTSQRCLMVVKTIRGFVEPYKEAMHDEISAAQNNSLVLPGTNTRNVVVASGRIRISPETRYVIVDTEGSAAADDLEYIDGGEIGQEIIVSGTSSARVVTLVNASDVSLVNNLRLIGTANQALGNARVLVRFVKLASGNGTWVQSAPATTTA